MGIGLKVSCSCFGSFTLQVGARIAPPPYSLFPFLCASCKGVTSLDIHARALACGHCGGASVTPYGSAPAVGEIGPTVVFACGPCDAFSVDQLTITDGTYWCPTCRQHTARFQDAGILWD